MQVKLKSFLLLFAVIMAVLAIFIPIFVQRLPAELQVSEDLLVPADFPPLYLGAYTQRESLHEESTLDSLNLSSLAWVIQVEQLTDPVAAEALVKELRQLQFNAFFQAFGDAWLVNVGPELDQQRLHDLSKQLTAKGYRGIYAHYYPVIEELHSGA